jgi:large subunit ribosomal protein L25
MEIVSLKVGKRSQTGKGPARRMRAAGKVPGVFYGPNNPEAVLLEIERLEFAKKLGGLEGSHLIQLQSDAADLKERMVLLREAQEHPVTGQVLHADFYEVDLTKRIEVEVPLHFVGKAAGAEKGGIIQPVVREIVVECLPTDIPGFIEVDVSALDIHDAIHVAELTLPAGAKAVYDDNFTVVTVLAPSVEEVAVEAPVEGAEAAAAPAESAAAGAKPGESSKKGEE